MGEKTLTDKYILGGEIEIALTERFNILEGKIGIALTERLNILGGK